MGTSSRAKAENAKVSWETVSKPWGRLSWERAGEEILVRLEFPPEERLCRKWRWGTTRARVYLGAGCGVLVYISGLMCLMSETAPLRCPAGGRMWGWEQWGRIQDASSEGGFRMQGPARTRLWESRWGARGKPWKSLLYVMQYPGRWTQSRTC